MDKRPISILNPPFVINLLATISITITSYSRKLLILIKIYIDEAKYNSQNNNSIIKLANLWKNILNNLLKSFWTNNKSE